MEAEKEKKKRTPPKRKPGTKSVSKSKKAGLSLPVSRINKHLRDAKATKRVSASAAIFVTAILELVASEILDAANELAAGAARRRINVCDLAQALRDDKFLGKVFADFSIFVGGRVQDVSKEVTYTGVRLPAHFRIVTEGAEDGEDE